MKEMEIKNIKRVEEAVERGNASFIFFLLEVYIIFVIVIIFFYLMQV